MLITAYTNGASAGCPPTKNDHERGKRGAIVGWSSAAVRRHTKWLYSVEADRLTGDGYAVTLTLKETPESHLLWGRMVRAWFKRLERAGAVRSHFVVEWQRRGTPHLHAAVYFPEGFRTRRSAHQLLVKAWLEIAAPYGARAASQHVAPITGALGWLQYLSKHAARGVAHYQRVGKPEGWERTGRLWGHRGAWPEGEPMKFDVAAPAYHRFRRLARAARVARARADLAALEARAARHTDPGEFKGAIAGARRRWRRAQYSLRCGDRRLSEVRGTSDWMPEESTLALIGLLWEEGHPVAMRSEAGVVDTSTGAVLETELV